MRNLICVSLISILGFCSFVQADDVDILGVEFDGTGAGIAQGFAHDPEDDPHKGWANVSVTNTGNEAWGDFHFEIYDPYNGGLDISNVSFMDATLTDHDNNPGLNPTSSQGPLTWTINNTVVGATIDLFFYSDPVGPGESATFSVYTDNADELSFFGLMMHPTPVPEPVTLALFGLGALALRRKR